MTEFNIGDLKPASYNPRKITPLQKEALRNSYTRYGDLSGVVFNQTTKNLVGGHQRISLYLKAKNTKIIRKAHKDATGTVAIGHILVPREGGGTTRIPYREVRWDGDKEAAANIAANSAGGSFDVPKLGRVLAVLEKHKYPIQDIPMDSLEIRQAIRAFEISQQQKPEKEPLKIEDGNKKVGEMQLTDQEMVVYRRAWRKLVGEWKDQMDTLLDRKYVTSNISKGALSTRFVEALFTGKSIGRLATTAYVPHRLLIAGDKHSMASLFTHALESKTDNMLDNIIWRAGVGSNLDKFLMAGLPIHGHRAPSDFPTDLALALIDEFCPSKGRVLDPCHGWGGRALGFLLSRRAQTYVGFDVDKRTHLGVQEMFDDLQPLAMMPKRAQFNCVPFEDSRLKPNWFDFALTSPPYYDTEKYGGKESCWRRYKNFDEWVVGFYKPLIYKTMVALKPGAAFCLQVGSQRYPLAKISRQIAKKIGMQYVETRSAGMMNFHDTPEEKGEVIIVLRKGRELS